MSRDFRTRYRTIPYVSGELWSRSGTFTGTVYNSDYTSAGIRRSICQDWYGRPTSDGSLQVDHEDRTNYVTVNGHYLSAGGDYEGIATGYIPWGARGAGLSPLYIPDLPYPGASMTDLLVRTNPSRPDYVPLTLLQDLKDIPRQLKDVGRLIRTPKRHLTNPRDVASQYLGWEFGWKPLIKDVQDLLDLQGHIHRRVGELTRLYSGKGLRRRVKLGRWSAHSDEVVTTESSYVLWVNVRRSIDTTVERWGTVRWKPTVTLPSYRPTDAEIIRKARQVTLGLSTEALVKGAWDLIPWTWIVDWFTNVGDFALQYSNTVPALPSSPNVMTRTRTKFVDTQTYITPGYDGGFGTMSHERKERYVGPATLSAHIPFIGNKRLSILSALFVQRFKR